MDTTIMDIITMMNTKSRLLTFFQSFNFYFQVFAFVYFFYQLQAISLMSSMTTTVVLAVERFLAVTKPVEYHLAIVASANRPWRRVMQYMIPTVVFCVLFNLPKFFELVIKSFKLFAFARINCYFELVTFVSNLYK